MPLFELAERRAHRLGVSRSKLYADALEEFLKVDRDAEITAKLNEIYGNEDSGLDPLWAAAQARSIAEEW